MKLKDILYTNYRPNWDNKEIRITYRAITPDKMDIFAGECKYNFETKELTSLDGDVYSLEDDITKWEYDDPVVEGDTYSYEGITVWFEAVWVELTEE